MSLVVIRKRMYSLNYFLHGADRYWKFLLKQQEQKWDHLFIVLQLLSCVQLFATPWTAAHQVSLSFTTSNSCPLSQWRHPTTSSSVVPFSSCPQSFPASGSFPMSQLFASGGQSTIQTFVGEVISPLFNTLPRFVIAFFWRVRVFKLHGCSHHLQWSWSPRK